MSALVVHHGDMAQTESYVTARGLLAIIATTVLDRFACVRKGHDPVGAGGLMFCRRCLNVLRR